MNALTLSLTELAGRAGARVSTHQNEAGGTAYVVLPGHSRRAFSHEHGDPLTATDKAIDYIAEYLVTRWQAQEGDDFEEVRQLQSLINRGVWGLEGSMGRAMMQAIESGACMLGDEPARDYWGNFIPARTQVQRGTKGSALYSATILIERA